MALSDPTLPGKVKVQFHYIKGPSYREVSCHGAFGGLTPQRKIWIALYTERTPLPQMLEYDVAPLEPGGDTVQLNEQTTKPDRIESRQGLIRHVEFSTYMDLDVARTVRDWLTRVIEQADQHKAASGEAKK